MQNVITIVVAVALLVAVVVLVPRLTSARAQSTDLAQCRALQRQLADARTQGGDQGVIEHIEAQLRSCIVDAQAAGAQVDTSGIDLGIAQAAGAQIDSEWVHYKSTDWADSVKRNNTRSNILRIAESDLVPDLRAALEHAESLASLAPIRDEITRQINKSIDRAQCILSDGVGCGRFGDNEDNWDQRGRDEIVRVMLPLGIIAALDDGWRPTLVGNPKTWDDELAAGDGYAQVMGVASTRPVENATVRKLLVCRALWRILDQRVEQYHAIEQAVISSDGGAYAEYVARRAQLSPSSAATTIYARALAPHITSFRLGG